MLSYRFARPYHTQETKQNFLYLRCLTVSYSRSFPYTDQSLQHSNVPYQRFLAIPGLLCRKRGEKATDRILLCGHNRTSSRNVALSFGMQKAVLEAPYGIVSYNRAIIFRLLYSKMESWGVKPETRRSERYPYCCGHWNWSGIASSLETGSGQGWLVGDGLEACTVL